MSTLKRWLKKNRISFIASLVGAILGFLYWYFVGCSNGSCAITSSPINSTIYGAIMGFLLIGIIKPEKINKDAGKVQ